MLLRRIGLTNVGVYRDTQTLVFSTDRSRPITLIGGRNGAGKTTLLNAIPLVLYGNRARGLLGASAFPEYLQRLIHQGESKASITLEFDRRESGKTCRYLIEREWTRSANGKATDSLYVTVNDKPRPDLEANWPEFVEGIMPLSVSGLAIFDGEKIEALADVKSSAEVLRTSLYGLLGLDLIEQLQRDLAVYRRKTAHRVAPAREDLRSQLTEAEDRLAVALADVDSLRSEVEVCERAVELASNEVAAAKDRLAEAGGDVFAKREQLHADLVTAEAQIASSKRRLETLIGGDLPLLMVKSLLEQVSGMGHRRQVADEGLLVLERMKERDERLLEKVGDASSPFSPEVVTALASLLNDDRQMYEVDHQVTFDVSRDATLTADDLLGSAGDELQAEASRLLHEVAASTDAAARARQALESVPDGDAIQTVVAAVAESEARLRAAEADLSSAAERADEGERRVATAQRELDRLAIQMLEEGVGDTDAARIARELDRAEATLSRFSRQVIQRHIDRISSNISGSLQALLRKEGLVNRISIDPDTLHLALFDRVDRRIESECLSAGERQMLATAVLWGLSKSTGRTLPTVIDTPVGRLDRSHRTNLVNHYFPSASRQVVLLSTDEELVGSYLGQLSPHVGCRYMLTYDDDRDVSVISEGYFE